MKRFFSLAVAVGLWLPLAARAAESPEDRYIAIYDLIQEADSLNDANDTRAAQAKYTAAQAELKKFAGEFPTWNVKIVNFRLNYLSGKISPVVLKPSAPVATNEMETGAASPSVASPAADNDALVNSLQAQLRQAQADKEALEAKLKDLSSAPAGGGTAQALADTQAKLQALTDENTQLKVTIKDLQARSAHAVDNSTLDRITQDLASARQKLEDQSRSITALTEEKKALEKRLETSLPTAPDSAQIDALQLRIKQVESDKIALQDQLNAAKAAAAAKVDASELAKAEDRVKALQRENNLLRASVEQNHGGTIELTNSVVMEQIKQSLDDTNQKLQQQTEQVAKLSREKAELQKQIDLLTAAGNSKELAETKKSLAALKRKYSIQTEAALILLTEANLKMARQDRINSALTKQAAGLQKQLSSLASNAKFVVEGLRAENENLQNQVADTKRHVTTNAVNPDFEQLQTQLATLRARMNVLEAQPVPFTPEELALFRKPETATLAVTDKKSKTKLPSGAAELIADAQRLFAAHKFDEAEQKYQDVLKLDPKNVYTLGNLATIELEMDKTDEAETHLQEALAIKPADAFCLGALGNLRFRQGKYDQALDALSHAAQLKPDDAEIQNFLGVTLSQKGQRTAAEAALRKAIQLDPQYGSAHNNLAVIYLTQNPPQIELARWHYQKALAAGQPRNEDLEKMLDQADRAANGDTNSPAKP
jgi:Flp pilus assembly protein TadD